MHSALSVARAAALVMVGVAMGAPAWAQPPPSPARRDDSLRALEPSCARAARAPARLVADAHWVDAHLVAETVDALCDGSGEPREWQLWNAVALIRLDEGGRARRILSALLASEPLSQVARALTAWSFLVEEDEAAFHQALRRVEPAARSRLLAFSAIDDARRFAESAAALEPSLGARAQALHARYRESRRKSPALAGVLSAILPGSGQVYAGSWQGAAVALVLNAISIGATVELARRELYVASALTGTAASIFYVGSILNAADLARRHNEIAAEPERAALERLLVHEAWP
jgi:hypothetical protein